MQKTSGGCKKIILIFIYFTDVIIDCDSRVIRCFANITKQALSVFRSERNGNFSFNKAGPTQRRFLGMCIVGTDIEIYAIDGVEKLWVWKNNHVFKFGSQIFYGPD